MDDTRRPSSPEPGQGGAAQLLGSALDQVLDDLPGTVKTLAVAVSGGPDSSAMAVLAAQRAQARGLALHVFHIHHGLYDHADSWAERTHALATRLGLPFAQQKVDVDTSDPRGIEAAARQARYDGLARMAHHAGIHHILLAHHQDDQVETVMLRLLRGAGLDGMSAMASQSHRDGICYLRPWLQIARSRILEFMQAYGQQTGFEAVQDPSNLDTRFGRGALRTNILPTIESHWPGYRSTFERFARLASESAAVLNDVAASDLAGVQEDQSSFHNCLSLSRLHKLPDSRQTMVLRRWLASHGLAMPSEARLQELSRQLKRAGPDQQMLLQHGDVHVRRYRDWVIVDREHGGEAAAHGDQVPLHWQGQALMRVDQMGGALQFTGVPSGIDPQWLGATPLLVRWRRGRERLKASAQTPSRSLKNLYQERGIPSWERERLPLVYRNDVLVYAAGLGADARLPQAQPGIQLEWLADRPGATVNR